MSDCWRNPSRVATLLMWTSITGVFRLRMQSCRATLVCVGACIQDDAVEIESYFLHFIDEFALYVALEIGELNVRILRGELSEIVFKRLLSVDFRFTHAQKV